MKITVQTLMKLAQEGQKITMLTCYDASFAATLDEAGVETLLVGDSLGMVMQGADSTLPVSLEEMAYHVRCVARGARNALIIGDMPFGSYQESPQQAFASAAKLMQAGAHMVKLEGGAFMADTTRFLVERGIPVCSHIGLTPQYVNTFGGYRVQGKSEDDAARIRADARALADAGASMVLMECVPAALAGFAHQRKMAVVQIAHGGHKSHAAGLAAPIAHRLDGLKNMHNEIRDGGWPAKIRNSARRRGSCRSSPRAHTP